MRFLKKRRENEYAVATSFRNQNICDKPLEAAAELFLHLKVFVCRILVTVDLHIRDVSFLGRGRLIDLDEALAVRASRAAPLEYGDANNRSRHECYASERECEINGSTFSVIHLSPYGITWLGVRNIVSHAVGCSNYSLIMHGGDRGGLLRLLRDILGIDRWSRVVLLVLLLLCA